jgi:hypothetical protein
VVFYCKPSLPRSGESSTGFTLLLVLQNFFGIFAMDFIFENLHGVTKFKQFFHIIVKLCHHSVILDENRTTNAFERLVVTRQ